jgi:hypothetical protein
MYDIVYNKYIGADVAHIREPSVFFDQSGNIVEAKDKFGEAVDIKTMHLDYILFGNKTGCNTSQNKDGHEAGTKYVVGYRQITQDAMCDHQSPVQALASHVGKWRTCNLHGDILRKIHKNSVALGTWYQHLGGTCGRK